MQSYKDFVDALNDFIHTWMLEFKHVELEYVYIEGEDIDNMRGYLPTEYMYIIWANGRQSRINLSYNYPCFSTILKDFLNKNYEKVPEDEYI